MKGHDMPNFEYDEDFHREMAETRELYPSDREMYGKLKQIATSGEFSARNVNTVFLLYGVLLLDCFAVAPTEQEALDVFDAMHEQFRPAIIECIKKAHN
jgi:hypothetical protein